MSQPLDQKEQTNVRPVVAQRFGVGESPVWDERRGLLFWTDIPAKAIYASGPDGAAFRSWTLPERACSLGLCQDHRLVLALASGVFLFDPESEALELLARPEIQSDDFRLNDGKVGPDGAFWVGSMHQARQRAPIASLFRVAADGAVSKPVGGVFTSNGLAWSPDGRVMYWSDSTAGWIDRFEFDPATGVIGARARVAQLNEQLGRPDGGACDAEGAYWSAGVSAGVLNRFSSEGIHLLALRLPTPGPTMPCFGGKDLRTLFVTSRATAIDPVIAAAYAHTGALLALDVGLAGTPAHRFG